MMRTFLIFFIVSLGLLFSSSLGFSATIEVCKTCPITTLGDAISSAVDGDEVFLRAGVYYESGLIIDKEISLRGEKGSILDGGGKAGSTGGKTILFIRANKVKVSGLVLRNVAKSHIKDFAAIKVRRSRHFVIENNHLENVFFGIKIEKSKYGLVKNNVVSGEDKSQATSGNGIHLWHSSKIKVEGNEVFGLRDGIYLEFVKKSETTNNKSYDNLRYGLHFMFSNHNTYTGNEFYRNGAGVAVMFSKWIVMNNNTFRDNWGSASYGLLLKEIYDAEIIGNLFQKNTIAINTEGSTRINVTNNNFIANGWAIKVAGACYENIYSKNNFIRNSFDLSYHNRLNDNSFTGNYWGSYSGYDLDRDGIGDVPHRPVKLFSYIVNRTPETIVLLRSLFVDIINFSEKVSPIFTPDDILDTSPSMREFSAQL